MPAQGGDLEVEASASASRPARPRSARGAARTEPRGQSVGAVMTTGTRNEAQQLSRCHLLYHQAIFASRESAQLESEIKMLKQKEEMRECTFRPKLLPTRRNSISSAPQPRNFETAVARMRSANRQRVQRREEVEHVPCGENYERLRRLGARPFSCYFKDKAMRQPALMYVDVNVGNGRTGRIRVREGDDLHALSRNFARTFQLDREMAKRLEEMLQQAYVAQTGTSCPSPLREKAELQAVHHELADAPSSLAGRDSPTAGSRSPVSKPPTSDPLASAEGCMAGNSDLLHDGPQWDDCT